MHSVGDKPYTSKRPDNSNKEVIKRTFKASGADQEILSQILQGIDEENKKETNKYGYGGITESKLRTILGNTAVRFSKKADQLTNDAANIANEEDVAKANFDTKNRVGAERLGKSLQERIEKGNVDLQQHRLKDQEQTSETIKKQLDIEKDYQLKILQEEQTEAEKKGTLSVTNAQKFAQLRNLIVQKYNNELLQENKEFLEKKAEQSANASDTLDVLQNTSNIKNDQSRIEENKQNETPALGAYTQLADDKNLKLQRDFDAEQERIQNEFDAAQFDSEDTKNAKALQIQEQFEESQLTLIHAMNANKLAAYSDFFTELDKEAKDKIAKILADEELGADQQIEKLSEKLVNGKISRTDYAYQKRLIGLDVMDVHWAYPNNSGPTTPDVNVNYPWQLMNNAFLPLPWEMNWAHPPQTKVEGSDLTFGSHPPGYYKVTDYLGAVTVANQPAKLVNYPMYFEPHYRDTLWDRFHWIDDPRHNPRLHRNWSCKIDLCCDDLNKLQLLGEGQNAQLHSTVRLDTQYYNTGVITEITVSYDSGQDIGKYIELKGIV
jgi:hypothetical protein